MNQANPAALPLSPEGPANVALFASLAQRFVNSPHVSTLGIEYVGVERRQPTLKLPWREAFLVSQGSDQLHGGAITTLVDTTGALSIVTHLESWEMLATLDLRIDYLRGALSGQTVFCTATCCRLTRHIGFAQAVCFQETPENRIAQAMLTFMRHSTPFPQAVANGESA